MIEPLAALQQWLGYTFARPALLTEALTHASYVNENKGVGNDYERLEFLGDAVLDLLVSQALILAHPQEREGALSRRRAQMVRERSLAALARDWQLGSYIRAGSGQREEGLGDSILADVLEALMGAVFLDGGAEAVQQVFAERLQAGLAKLSAAGATQDDKTRLQELCHKRQLPQPQYAVRAIEGPSHQQTFFVRLVLGAAHTFEASGRNKKTAEQRCAHAAYLALTKA